MTTIQTAWEQSGYTLERQEEKVYKYDMRMVAPIADNCMHVAYSMNTLQVCELYLFTECESLAMIRTPSMLF